MYTHGALPISISIDTVILIGIIVCALWEFEIHFGLSTLGLCSLHRLGTTLPL